MYRYTEAETLVVEQVQAERRAEANACRIAAHGGRFERVPGRNERRAGWRERLGVAAARPTLAALR